jgi:hypothetical protein
MFAGLNVFKVPRFHYARLRGKCKDVYLDRNSRPSGLISLSIRIRKKGAALPRRSYLYDRYVERCDERFGWALSQRHLVKTWSPALLLFVSREAGSTAVQTVAPD